MDTLDKVIEINELLAIYQSLLTPKQQKLMIYYYEDDYSLKEIADIENISRNAVHDQLKRSVAKLEEFEALLQLNSKRKLRLSLYNDIVDLSSDETIIALIKQLEKVE